MKEMPLTQNMVALVDDADYDSLIVRSWCYHHGYALAKINGKNIEMHRWLLNAPKGMDIDHINGNGIDNRRCNIRIVTRAQNIQNRHRKTTKGFTSKFQGVCWENRTKKWRADIRINKKTKALGRFISEIEAAKVYDIAARKHYGKHAKINFP